MESKLEAGPVKRELLRRFSCSETMLTVLDRAAGLTWKELEEASDPLCAGIVAELDSACGALWGAALAAGVRARHRIMDRDEACRTALEATRRVMEAYARKGRPLDCGELLGQKKWSFLQFMMRGNLRKCQGQLSELAPEFHELLEQTIVESRQHPRGGKARQAENCAVEAFRRVSSAIGLKSDGYEVVAAGLAGGLGLSGNACGALAAAVLAVSLKYFQERNRPKHSMIRSLLQGVQVGVGWMEPSKQISRGFRSRFGTKLCAQITGKSFARAEELAAHLEAGGCDAVLEEVTADAAKALAR
jgi:hypothetical protein